MTPCATQTSPRSSATSRATRAPRARSAWGWHDPNHDSSPRESDLILDLCATGGPVRLACTCAA
eukprot:122694-Prymnesium_polylepis.1